MKSLGITFKRKSIEQVFVGIIAGWMIGLCISYLNIFGSSENAPLICALGGGIVALGRLLKQQK